VLFRTTDGGANWSEVELPALPTNDVVLHISGPRFFDANDGLLATAVEDPVTQQDHDVIYTTSDGGANWAASVAPATVPNASFNTDGTLSASFGSAKSWYILAGKQLYVTRNAGQVWASSIPKAEWSHGPFQLDAIDFVNATTGWADLIYNSCGGLPRSSPRPACPNEIALASTSSAGHAWTLLSTESST
jgi:photosystem II stability/assembly factor-like uncharacterized protein